MKKINCALALLLFLAPGCFVTMPEINNAFIKNKSDAEKADLNKIQNDIIAINKEIRELEKNTETIRQKLLVARKKTSLLEYQKPYLEELVKLYMLTEEGEKLGKARSDLGATDEEIRFVRELTGYYSAFVDLQAFKVETKQAELSVKIAEQELEKAYIISKGKPAGTEGEGKDKKPSLKYREVPCTVLGKGLDVNVCAIAEHFFNREQALAEKKKELEATTAKFLEAEKGIKKFGKNYDF